MDTLVESFGKWFSDRGSIPLASTKVWKTRVNAGFFICLHEFYTNFYIFSNMLIALSSSLGYKWAYVFHVISILECPNLLEISWILIPSLASNEAWECLKSCILICGNPALSAYWLFLFDMLVSLKQVIPPHTLKSSVKFSFCCYLNLCSCKIRIRFFDICISRYDDLFLGGVSISLDFNFEYASPGMNNMPFYIRQISLDKIDSILLHSVIPFLDKWT